MTREAIHDQGEVSVFRIDQLPAFALRPHTETTKDGYVISHSESGHHHVLERTNVEVMERTEAVPAGMRILYAIVREPTRLFQDASNAHGEARLAPGVYEFRIAREFDPFLEQARRVAD